MLGNRFRGAMAALSLLAGSTGVMAGEFGNVFGPPEVETASRQASAMALEGIEQAIAGLRQRELREGTGADNFKAAAESLRKAGSQMKELTGAFPDFDFTEEQSAYLVKTLVNNPFVDTGSVKTLSQLYEQFALQTLALAGLIEGASEQPNAFRVIAKPLADYFALADAIVRLREMR